MLLAIKNAFEERGYHDNIQFCAEHGPGRDYFSLAKNDMMQMPRVGRKNFAFLKGVLPMIPRDIRQRLGVLLPGEVDHLLDGSGFGFGDYWGASRPTDQMLRTCRSIKKKGGKVILLPQALGPFENKKVKANFSKLVDAADLICARDKVSFGNLVSSYGSNSKFKLYPDFTNLLETPPRREYEEGNVCVIPNEKMTKVKNRDSEKYYRWLVETIRGAVNMGFVPYWLIHEGKGDFQIAEQVNAQLSTPLQIVHDSDPLVLKHRIKCCRFIIVSRFHGCVSALSQAIPTIMTSWSHKYRMLAQNYGIDNFLVDVFDEKAISRSHDLMLTLKEDESYLEIVSKLGLKAKSEKLRSKAMWNDVFEILDGAV